MKRKTLYGLLFTVLIFGFLSGCNNSTNQSSGTTTFELDAQALQDRLKYKPGDPFIETMKKSEFFKLSGLEDHVVETKSGMILSIPKGAFRDQEGNIVEKEIEIEVADIQTLEDQIMSNIPVSPGGKTVYLNATHQGEQLVLNQDAPVYMETENQAWPGQQMMVFEGIRNENGEMQWLNPQKPKRHLIPMDLEALDFLPAGFAETVKKGMPFRGHNEASKELIDSLYYSMAADRRVVRKVVARPESDAWEGADTSSAPASHDAHGSSGSTCQEISPASIQVLKSKKFEGTLIATKQFIERIRYLHMGGSQEALEKYIEHIDKDLCYIDSLVSAHYKIHGKHGRTRRDCPEEEHYHTEQVALDLEQKFKGFYEERYGNVKDIPASVKKLGKFYSQELKATQKKLQKLQDAYDKELNKKAKEAEEVHKAYQQVLQKRQEYRLNKFGFEVKKLGWIGVRTEVKKLDTFTLDFHVQDGKSYDRVHVYALDKRIKSICAFLSHDQETFNRLHSADNILLYLKGQNVNSIAIAYRDNQPYYDMQSFLVEGEIHVNFTLQSIAPGELKALLKDLGSGHQSFNKVEVDLEYQEAFHKEKLRVKRLQEEAVFLWKLRRIARPCSC